MPTQPQPPASGSRPPASRSRAPASGSRPPPSGSQPPASGSQPPASGSQPPASGSQPPVSGSQPPASGSQPPVSGSQPPASGSQPPVSGSQPSESESQPTESHILEVDLKEVINNMKHHTEEMSTERLFVRRGQSFNISLKFKEEFKPEVDKLTFTAMIGEQSEENRGTRSVFSIPNTVGLPAQGKSVWKAELGLIEVSLCELSSDGTDPETTGCEGQGAVGVIITPPANAPVGKYSLFLNYAGEDKELGTLALLFNPWCKDDSVFMAKNKRRQEYVLNEHGVIFKGSGNYIHPSDWDYGQLEEIMVDLSFLLLDMNNKHVENPAEDEAARWDPVYISRIVCAMINSDDDRGVLLGRWGGPYWGGKAPSHWSGSYAILTEWCRIGCHPVKYGQCWVFAGVMCSVMRTLGIPCRVVTNYESAHDTDRNLIIDVFHPDYGVWEMRSPDSVWNYHVWVECWMKRPDLPPGFDGWQVLDPTPQERSQGEFKCGPASVKAILNGNTDLPYDVPFVFAEVNADCVDWLVKADRSKKKIWSDTKRVGQNISTKSLGSDKRKNITRHYKPKEGSEEERKVYTYAATRDYSMTVGEVDSEESEEEGELTGDVTPPKPEEPPQLPEVSVKFEEESEPLNGKDVKLSLLVHSEAPEPRPLSINTSVIAKSYNGSAHSQIQSELKNHTLLPGKNLRVPVVVPFSQYWKPMLDSDVMKVSAIVSDTHLPEAEVYLAESDVVLVDPPIQVKILEEARVYRQVMIEISFVNPVSETLKDLVMTLSGSGLWKEDQDVSLPDLGPKRKIRVKLYFWPYKAGDRTLVVDLNCSMFRDIKTSLPIHVNKLF